MIDDRIAIDDSETHSTHSIALQKIMAEQVQPDIVDPPHHKLKPGIQLKLDVLLKEYATQFAKDEQVPAYFQELMTRILKDFDFTIANLDDIIIFSRMAEEHLSHIKKVFKKLQSAKLSMKLSKCHFFSKEIQYLGHILRTKGIHPLPSKTQAIQKMHPPTTPKQVCACIWILLILFDIM